MSTGESLPGTLTRSALAADIWPIRPDQHDHLRGQRRSTGHARQRRDAQVSGHSRSRYTTDCHRHRNRHDRAEGSRAMILSAMRP